MHFNQEEHYCEIADTCDSWAIDEGSAERLRKLSFKKSSASIKVEGQSIERRHCFVSKIKNRKWEELQKSYNGTVVTNFYG